MTTRQCLLERERQGEREKNQETSLGKVFLSLFLSLVLSLLRQVQELELPRKEQGLEDEEETSRE
jgi:hypothetical protein